MKPCDWRIVDVTQHPPPEIQNRPVYGFPVYGFLVSNHPHLLGEFEHPFGRRGDAQVIRPDRPGRLGFARVDVKPLADDPRRPSAILHRLDPRRINSAYGWRMERASIYSSIGPMDYDIYYLKDALASLKRMSPEVSRRIVNKIERMRNGLTGDVKRLKAFVPNYRLRVGDWRVLFEVDGKAIVVHEVKHRSEAYD